MLNRCIISTDDFRDKHIAADLASSCCKYANNHSPHAPNAQSAGIQAEIEVKPGFLRSARQDAQSRQGECRSRYDGLEQPGHDDLAMVGVQYPHKMARRS